MNIESAMSHFSCSLAWLFRFRRCGFSLLEMLATLARGARVFFLISRLLPRLPLFRFRSLFTPANCMKSPVLAWCHLKQVQSAFQRRRHCRRPERGFTLIEVLVAIVIIAVLAMLILPGIKGVLQRSEEARCAGNLRQIGAAAFLYVGDNNGYLPGSRELGKNWKDLLSPYVDVSKLACPTYKKAGYFSTTPPSTYSWNIFLGFYYGVTGTWTYHPRTLASVPRPAFESMVVDATGRKANDMNEYYQNNYGDPDSDHTCPALHRSGFNVLFIDGHVEWRSKQWINNRVHTDVFWGNPQWW